MTFIIIVAIILYFLFRNSSVKFYSNTSGIPHGFTYDDIDVRILALSSAVIKADGHISPEEIGFVRRSFISQYGQMRAERAFANFKSFPNKDSVEHICRELHFTLSYDSRQSILVFLFHVASADGNISDREVRTIASIASWLGIAQQHFYHIYTAFAQNAYSAAGSASEQPSRSPYDVLGVDEMASVEQIKQSYRILVKKYHPDRMVKYPEAEQKIAREKFIEIQKAYERLKKERNF